MSRQSNSLERRKNAVCLSLSAAAWAFTHPADTDICLHAVLMQGWSGQVHQWGGIHHPHGEDGGTFKSAGSIVQMKVSAMGEMK